MISKAKLTMECTVVDIYNSLELERFICIIDAAYMEENYLNDTGKID